MHAPSKFWLVWSPQGATPPRYRHASEAAAINEARRLAELKPGSQFYVLEATGVAEKVSVAWTPITETEIPL